MRRNEVWILTVSSGNKCPGGKQEIISESHCSLKMKSISILGISYFRKINQSWNKISVVHSSLFTKFCFLNTPLHSKRQHLFCHSKAPQHNVLGSGSQSQGLPTFLFHYFHVSFHSNNTLWAPFTPAIPISKWPYTNLCSGHLHAHLLTWEILLCQKMLICFQILVEKEHIFSHCGFIML